MSGSGIVVFVYADWVSAFPEFATVSSGAATNNFNIATMYCDNSANSPVVDIVKRTTILYLLTGHVTSLLTPVAGVSPSPLVGRVSNASEGSVSVSADLPTTPNGAWFAQSKYGLMAWQAMAPYRTALYIAPVPFCSPYGGAYLWGSTWPM